MSEDAFRVRCTDGCRPARLLIGRAAAEHAGRRHHDRTGHASTVEPVASGDAVRVDGGSARGDDDPP